MQLQIRKRRIIKPLQAQTNVRIEDVIRPQQSEFTTDARQNTREDLSISGIRQVTALKLDEEHDQAFYACYEPSEPDEHTRAERPTRSSGYRIGEEERPIEQLGQSRDCGMCGYKRSESKGIERKEELGVTHGDVDEACLQPIRAFIPTSLAEG